MPLSDLSKNSRSTRPSVPNRLVRACSSAALAVVALPERDRCQPKSSRVWQSISEEDQETVRGTVSPTNAGEAQPSLPAQARARSVDQRSFGAVATEGTASMRGRMPTARLRTCQPLSWSEASNAIGSREMLNPLDRVLVEPREPRDGAIAEGGLGLEHRLDRLGDARIGLRRRLDRRVIDCPPRHAEPGAELGDRHCDALGQQALMERPDQLFGAVLGPMAHSPLTPSRSMRAASFFRARSSSIASP